MKVVGIILVVLVCVFVILDITIGVYGWYRYSRDIGSYWSLAEKASTINQKADYIDKFVQALEGQGMSGQYNAVFFQTPDNSFDKNMEALKSLQTRLCEIKTMDITSFQYQTAIQQITAQEQGEANEMMGVFRGIWWKTHYLLLWNWMLIVNVCVLFLLGMVGVWCIIDT